MKVVEVDGEVYPTRYGDRLTATSVIPSAGFTTPVHEAAHAVIAIAEGFTVIEIELRNNGEELGATRIAGTPSPVARAAGERAANRWLHEQGIWTPELAVAVEITAKKDRQHYDDLDTHNAADKVINDHWDVILAVADRLADTRHLTGDTVADTVKGKL